MLNVSCISFVLTITCSIIVSGQSSPNVKELSENEWLGFRCADSNCLVVVDSNVVVRIRYLGDSVQIVKYEKSDSSAFNLKLLTRRDGFVHAQAEFIESTAGFEASIQTTAYFYFLSDTLIVCLRTKIEADAPYSAAASDDFTQFVSWYRLHR